AVVHSTTFHFHGRAPVLWKRWPIVRLSRGGEFSVLYGVDPDFGGLAAAGRNGEVEAVETFSLLAIITGGFGAEGGGNFGQQPVVIRISHLENVENAMPPGRQVSYRSPTK